MTCQPTSIILVLSCYLFIKLEKEEYQCEIKNKQMSTNAFIYNNRDNV